MSKELLAHRPEIKSHKRQTHNSPHKATIVNHEARHALVAYEKNKLKKISFTPIGTSIARVYFDEGSVRDQQEILAANLTGPDDLYSECASDFMMFYKLQHTIGGISLKEARHEADRIINKYPYDVLAKILELLSTEQEVTNDGMRRIIMQAYDEVETERMLPETGYFQNVDSDNSQDKH